MSEIKDPNSTFQFDKLILNKPIQISGNYFIKYSIDGQPLYIQPPKSVIKQLIMNKSAKKSHCDLLFSQDNEEFIQWIETLESHSQKKIYENRSSWFESELELDDIENSFTSPMKSYKSGTFYIIRTNMTPRLGKITVKIYDESETDIPIGDVSGNMNVVTILEVQGIKCSAKSFQIEIELKQMMVLKPLDLFEKCIVKTNRPMISTNSTISTISIKQSDLGQISDSIKTESVKTETYESTDLGNNTKTILLDKTESFLEQSELKKTEPSEDTDLITNKAPIINTEELTEIDFDLAEIPDSETVQIKARDDVYYEMYRNAIKKAKIAKDLALSAYLEAKDIKNKYMLNDISDSDSDLDEFYEEDEDDEN
jgi:hypothetical protein